MDTIHKETYRGHVIKILPDITEDTPDQWGNRDVFLVANHHNFYVKPPKNSSFESVIADYEETHYVFGLEAYIHGGVVLALSHEGNFPDRQWDVSQLGVVLAEKKSFEDKRKAKAAALSLIAVWNDCLSGNVYGFQVEDEEGNEIESCWGFIGDYDEKGGCLEEARRIVDWNIKENQNNFLGQAI